MPETEERTYFDAEGNQVPPEQAVKAEVRVYDSETHRLLRREYYVARNA